MRRNILYDVKSGKIVEYKKRLDNRLMSKYYNNVINTIVNNMKSGKYDTRELDTVFSAFINNYGMIDKEEYLNKMKEHEFFIPDLNEELDEDSWGWTHAIWSKAQGYEKYIKKEFVECVQSRLKNANTIGKYRIEALNEQYYIKM